MSCPDCFRGVIHDYSEPLGREEVLHGVRTYIAGRSDSAASTSTIIFITDAFGFNLVNSKLLADFLAEKSGFRVLVPDVVPGGGVPVSVLEKMDILTSPVNWWEIRGQGSRIFSLFQVVPHFLPVIMKGRQAFGRILPYVRAVRADLPEGSKLGVAGYCWGGDQTTRLSKEASFEGGNKPLVDAHYLAHPSSVKVPEDILDAVDRFHVPFSLAIGDRDFLVSAEKVAQLQDAMIDRCVNGPQRFEYQIEIYPGCGHGFTVRADRGKAFEDTTANQAAIQAVEWFQRFLS